MVSDPHSPISLSTAYTQTPPERLLNHPGQKCPGNCAKIPTVWLPSTQGLGINIFKQRINIHNEEY